MPKKVNVTVLSGCLVDADGEHKPGAHVKIDESALKSLVDNGVVVEGKVDLKKPAIVGKDTTPKVNVNVDQKRLLEFSDAINKLEEGNEEHWTDDGLPDVNALKSVSNFETTAEERNAVWPLLESLR